jgi:hypothetical protein
MITLKFLIAKFIFDYYLWDKPHKEYNERDWLLEEWCRKVFNEYRKHIEKDLK